MHEEQAVCLEDEEIKIIHHIGLNAMDSVMEYIQVELNNHFDFVSMPIGATAVVITTECMIMNQIKFLAKNYPEGLFTFKQLIDTLYTHVTKHINHHTGEEICH